MSLEHRRLPPQAQSQMAAWLVAHIEELRALLAPYGIRPEDVRVPAFEHLLRPTTPSDKADET